MNPSRTGLRGPPLRLYCAPSLVNRKALAGARESSRIPRLEGAGGLVLLPDADSRYT